MGLLDRFRKPAVDVGSFKTSTLNPEDCEGCEFSYPASLSVDQSNLWNTCPPNSCQILVATGKTDWSRDPKDDKGSYAAVCGALSKASDKFEGIVGGDVRVNATNEENLGSTIRVTILPQFLYVDTTVQQCVEHVLAALSVTSTAAPVPAPLKKLEEKGLILLCSHKTRDKKCSITAPPLRSALEIELRDVGLYRDFDDNTPGGVRVLYVNHVGGHKWAANCFYYGSDGSAVLMARVRPEYAKSIVQKTVLEGVVFPELLRNCSKNKAFEW